MSVHLPPSGGPALDDDDESRPSDEDDNDENWDDFAEDSIAQQSCVSLFEDTTFPSVTEALENDKSKYDFDIDKLCSRMSAYPIYLNPYIFLMCWTRLGFSSADSFNQLHSEKCTVHISRMIILD